jgi:hypothetical protein
MNQDVSHHCSNLDPLKNKELCLVLYTDLEGSLNTICFYCARNSLNWPITSATLHLPIIVDASINAELMRVSCNEPNSECPRCLLVELWSFSRTREALHVAGLDNPWVDWVRRNHNRARSCLVVFACWDWPIYSFFWDSGDTLRVALLQIAQIRREVCYFLPNSSREWTSHFSTSSFGAFSSTILIHLGRFPTVYSDRCLLSFPPTASFTAKCVWDENP